VHVWEDRGCARRQVHDARRGVSCCSSTNSIQRPKNGDCGLLNRIFAAALGGPDQWPARAVIPNGTEPYTAADLAKMLVALARSRDIRRRVVATLPVGVRVRAARRPDQMRRTIALSLLLTAALTAVAGCSGSASTGVISGSAAPVPLNNAASAPATVWLPASPPDGFLVSDVATQSRPEWTSPAQVTLYGDPTATDPLSRPFLAAVFHAGADAGPSAPGLSGGRPQSGFHQVKVQGRPGAYGRIGSREASASC